MRVRFLERDYESCLWVASGTFGWGCEAREGDYWPRGLGALLTKGVSLLPMEGAPHPRIFESGHGVALLNAIGLQNPGLKGFLERYASYYDAGRLPCPVWVNVLGDSEEGYRDVIQGIVTHVKAQGADWLAGFEINVSCPNVDKGGVEFGADPKSLERLTRICSEAAGSWPVMVKLSPLAWDPMPLVRAVEQGGGRAISLVNTLPAGVPEPEKSHREQTHWTLGRRFGGLSGPALRPVSLRLVGLVASQTQLGICGVGGINSAHDVREYLAAGAHVVQIGTANFGNPWICEDIAEEFGWVESRPAG